MYTNRDILRAPDGFNDMGRAQGGCNCMAEPHSRNLREPIPCAIVLKDVEALMAMVVGQSWPETIPRTWALSSTKYILSLCCLCEAIHIAIAGAPNK